MKRGKVIKQEERPKIVLDRDESRVFIVEGERGYSADTQFGPHYSDEPQPDLISTDTLCRRYNWRVFYRVEFGHFLIYYWQKPYHPADECSLLSGIEELSIGEEAAKEKCLEILLEQLNIKTAKEVWIYPHDSQSWQRYVPDI